MGALPNLPMIEGAIVRTCIERLGKPAHRARSAPGWLLYGFSRTIGRKTQHRRSNELGGRRGQENSRVHQGPWWVSGRSSCVTELGTDAGWVNEVG